ncbi:hypothetical protein [Mesobacillus harenae]|uniref:hypothetical protein n=1 Tax=Mesobacillus harenae TaxID=2213203 RepID=UPI001580F376|nr:hypothetical protein [Mesobacillus harenae]
MADSYEYLIFIKELGRLFEEYENCHDSELRQEIYKDIQLIGKAIEPEQEL